MGTQLNDNTYFDIIDGKRVVCKSLKRGDFTDVSWTNLLGEIGLSEIYNEDTFVSIPPHKKISNERLYQHDKDRSLFVAIITYGNSVKVTTTRRYEDVDDPHVFIREKSRWGYTQTFIGSRYSAYSIASKLVGGIREMYA